MIRGQITTAWVLGIGASVILSAFGSTTLANRLSQDRDYEQVQRVSALEAKVERIPYIESKVDLILNELRK